jgi:hypothetical protein
MAGFRENPAIFLFIYLTNGKHNPESHEEVDSDEIEDIAIGILHR